jgi:hypothetical protein
MNSDLPATGTMALLELLDPFIPDDFINACWPHGRTGGRHREHPAARVALGGRTLKTGQSRCFVGYKKHTLRLWLHDYSVGVLLVPLVS